MVLESDWPEVVLVLESDWLEVVLLLESDWLVVVVVVDIEWKMVELCGELTKEVNLMLPQSHWHYLVQHHPQA